MSEEEPPIHSIPRELLVEIFRFTLAEGITFHNPKTHPWRLALVCRTWRDITFDTPQLWANIRAVFGYKSKLNDAIFAAWRQLLKRSKSHPLTLYIEMFQFRVPELFPSLLESCFEHADRWESIEFCLPIDDLLVTSNRHLRCPRLQSLVLQNTPTARQHPAEQPEFELFQHAPLLHKLVLQSFSHSVQNFRLPWSQIDHLCIDSSASLQKIIDISLFVPNLTTLQVSGVIFDTEDLTSSVRVFPSLQKLTWTASSAGHSEFFDRVRAPRLNEIHIDSIDEQFFDSLERFISGSGCIITSVGFGLGTPCASKFLDAHPDVHTVTFYTGARDEDSLLDLAFDKSKPQWLGPKISRIIFQNVVLTKSQWEELLTMIKSRLSLPEGSDGRGCKLESLHFIQSPQWRLLVRGRVPLDPFSSFNFVEENLVPRYAISITYESTRRDMRYGL